MYNFCRSNNIGTVKNSGRPGLVCLVGIAHTCFCKVHQTPKTISKHIQNAHTWNCSRQSCAHARGEVSDTPSDTLATTHLFTMQPQTTDRPFLLSSSFPYTHTHILILHLYRYESTKPWLATGPSQKSDTFLKQGEDIEFWQRLLYVYAYLYWLHICLCKWTPILFNFVCVHMSTYCIRMCMWGAVCVCADGHVHFISYEHTVHSWWSHAHRQNYNVNGMQAIGALACVQ